ncbi:MAG TPA: hypothetical protein VGU67_02765 [Edaphobacter sp.]|nr:hypothetical protein [Edaphobacter sp.]
MTNPNTNHASPLTPEQRSEAETLLGIMADSQTKLWEAASDIEGILGFDVNTTDDLEGLGLDDIIAKYRPSQEAS